MDVPNRSSELSLSQSGCWFLSDADDYEKPKDLPRLEAIEELKRCPEYKNITKGEVSPALRKRIKGTRLLRGTKYENLFDLNYVKEHGEIERVRVMVGEKGIIHCGPRCWNSSISFLVWNLLFATNAFIPNLDLAVAEQKLNNLDEKGVKGFLFRLDPSDENAFILSYATDDGVQHVRFIYDTQKNIIQNPAVKKLQYNTLDELILDYINENQVPINLIETLQNLKVLGLDVENPVEEFKTIPQIKKSTFDFLTAEAKNKKGNRYSDVLPFNENRIKLNSGQYINASRVTVPEGATYICAQGPIQEYNHHTFDEFWEMVWQENVPVIVMVTDLKERDKEKCGKYWPECGYRRVKFGDVGVECVSEQVRYAGSASKEEEGLTLRTFKITKDNEAKIVHQLKYEKWADQGIANLDLVNKMIDDTNVLRSELMDKPILVHCSAGIGRTGTFIAEHHLSFVIDKALAEGIPAMINVKSTVLQLRNVQSGRVNMVQNENQYQHIYQTLRKRYHYDF